MMKLPCMEWQTEMDKLLTANLINFITFSPVVISSVLITLSGILELLLILISGLKPYFSY